MKIAFFEVRNRGREKSFFDRNLKGHKVVYFNEPLTEDNAHRVKGFDAVSIFIYSKINKKVLSMLPKLKLVATRSTGYDHIDIRECAKRKVTVCNVPYYGENTVAEHTFALILALSRNVHKSYVRSLRRDFSIEGLQGFDLKGKTLGVVGAGRIGLHVIRIGRGFGMNVLAYDVHPDKWLSEVMHFNYVPLEELLKKSDIITLHVPYNEHTHHLINRETLKLVKKGTILINTSRGAVVDTDALIEALESGKLGGAGLDVLEGEEYIKEEKQLLYDKNKTEALGSIIKDHILLNMDNVVFTPHIAFYSKEALERIWQTTVDNILAFEKGEPQYTVN
ncbi:hydroxyacid dehydrogenase [Candidatus Woesearchaeota archaeon]|nr:MAG: hydroxyacid dehydrogenase [Candidatus Woesearchaeota archaeon]